MAIIMAMNKHKISQNISMSVSVNIKLESPFDLGVLIKAR